MSGLDQLDQALGIPQTGTIQIRTEDLDDFYANWNAIYGGGPTAGAASRLYGFASGGIVTEPTLAMIGESGPEAIIPLGNGGSSGGNTYNFTIEIKSFSPPSTQEADKVANYIFDSLDRLSQRRRGMPL